MKRYVALLAGILMVLGAADGMAIDRDAKMIDSLGLRLGALDGADSRDVILHGENALPSWSENWALLVEIGHDSMDPDRGADRDAWHAGVGARWYASQVLSFSSLGTFGREYNTRAHDRPEYLHLSAGTRFRLAPADDVLSPYLAGELDWIDSDSMPNTDFGIQVGVGCDLMISKVAAVQLDARYQDADGADYDGMIVGVAMKYFWEE